MTESVLKAVGLHCERNDRVLFSDLSFDLTAGQIMRIKGMNGSGKTSLLNILSGLTDYYAGEVFWQGKSRQSLSDGFKQSLLYLGHKNGVSARLTPQENLSWLSTLHPALDDGRIQLALEAVNLVDCKDIPCRSLSAGQNRRVSLARLFMTQAKLWIMDEPLTAIDHEGLEICEQRFKSHVEAGGSIILTTHNELPSTHMSQTIDLDQI